MNAIEIFRAGTHTSMEGATQTITREMLQACAESYDPTKHEAPLVIGHPATDAPAYGWVKKLRVEGDRLLAETGELEPAFADAVKEGRYKKISAAFWTADAAQNPSPGVMSLKHVGFLGAAAPAVKGLRAVKFAGDTSGVVMFGEDAFAAFTESIEAKVRAKYENKALVERLINEGRVLPVHESGIMAFMAQLDDKGVIQFAEHGETRAEPPLAWFRRFLTQQPVVVHYGQMEMPPPPEAGAASGVDIPRGYSVARHDDGLLAAVKNHEREHKVSFAEALRAVTEKRGR